jgi:hypothetical protein
MMYPIMVKIDFGEVIKAGKSIKPVGLTLFIDGPVKSPVCDSYRNAVISSTPQHVCKIS